MALEKVRLQAPSVLTGSFRIPNISLEEGVIVNGSVTVGELVSDLFSESQDSQIKESTPASLSLAE